MSSSCSFKLCKDQLISKDCARVEVKSAVPSSGLEKYDKIFLVSWTKNGEGLFHPNCWNLLLTLARQRGSSQRKRKRSMGFPENLVMVQSEKAMIKEASKTLERFDSAGDMGNLAHKVSDMIQKSKHCVFFTGAGISTSAGLGDFRGKDGKWTEQDRDELDLDSFFHDSEESKSEPSRPKIARNAHDENQANHKDVQINQNTSKEEEEEEEEEKEDVMYEELRPTFTHEAIAKLTQLDVIKHLISQNCDGLHLLSGVPAEKISELHGNVFVEKCEKCDRRFERSHYVCDDVADMYLEELSDFGKTDIIKPKFMKECKRCGLSHRTGRKCGNKACKGYLIDTIINFGDHLEDEILDKAFEAAEACDLMVCLGTTLKVTPANELVDYVKNPRRIVICNRQPTDKDHVCKEKDKKGEPLGVRVYGDCDKFMKYVMKHLLGQIKFDSLEKDLKTKSSAYNDRRKTQS